MEFTLASHSPCYHDGRTQLRNNSPLDRGPQWPAVSHGTFGPGDARTFFSFRPLENGETVSHDGTTTRTPGGWDRRRAMRPGAVVDLPCQDCVMLTTPGFSSRSGDDIDKLSTSIFRRDGPPPARCLCCCG